MRFDKPNCPKCGEPASSVLESLQGDALIFEQDDGSFDYEGETEVKWDSQETLVSRRGLVTLSCGNHSWKARMEED